VSDHGPVEPNHQDVPLVLLQDGRVRVLADEDGIAFDDNLRTQLLEVRALIQSQLERAGCRVRRP